MPGSIRRGKTGFFAEWCATHLSMATDACDIFPGMRSGPECRWQRDAGASQPIGFGGVVSGSLLNRIRDHTIETNRRIVAVDPVDQVARNSTVNNGAIAIEVFGVH